MDSELPSARKRGVALMVVLGVVVFFTMLGFMGLEMAMKDSQVSGTLLDIKSKESAAWGGLNLALGVMQADPTTTVAELQKFVADSSLARSSKRQWLSFSGGSFTLVSAEPGFYTLGSGGDQSGVKVRIVSMNINGSTGVTDGSGIPITLECTGQGRNSQQLKILASYRMLGVDVPTKTVVTNVALPQNALYLNGSLNNLNSPIGSDAPVYTSGFYKANTNGSLTIKTLRIGGYVDLAGTGNLTVTGNAYVGGYLFVNTNFPIWIKGSLGVGGGLSTINDSLKVDGSLSVFGTPSTYSWQAGKSLRVGGQLWIRDEPMNQGSGLNPQGPIYVKGNAFFGNGFRTGSSVRDSFYKALQISGNNYSPDFSGPVFANRILYTGNKSFNFPANSASDSISVDSNFVISNAAAPLSISAGSRISVRGITQLFGGVSSWGNGSLSLRSRKRLDLFPGTASNPGSKLEAWDTVTVNGSVSGVFGAFKSAQPAANRLFRVKSNGGGASMTNQSGPLSVNGSGYVFTVPAADAVLVPQSLTALGMSASDTMVALSDNPPDTVRLSGTGTTDWTGNFIRLSAYKDSISSPSFNLAGATGTMLSNLYTFVKNRNRLSGGSTGYMFLYVDRKLAILGTDASKFSGKMVLVVDSLVDASYNWPASNSSSDIQVIYIPSGSTNCATCAGTGNLVQFGSVGPIYGYMGIEKTLPTTLMLQWGTNTANVCNWYGAMSLGFNPNIASSNTGGVLNLKLTDPATQTVFNDLASIGILHTTAGSGSGSGSVTYSTKQLTTRSPAGGIQFTRMGEFR